MKVVECLKFDEAEGCDIQDGNKIGRSVIEELEIARNKVVTNSFSDGTTFIEKFQGVGTMLISNHANRIECQNVLDKNPETPKHSWNETWMKLELTQGSSCCAAHLELK